MTYGLRTVVLGWRLLGDVLGFSNLHTQSYKCKQKLVKLIPLTDASPRQVSFQSSDSFYSANHTWDLWNKKVLYKPQLNNCWQIFPLIRSLKCLNYQTTNLDSWRNTCWKNFERKLPLGLQGCNLNSGHKMHTFFSMCSSRRRRASVSPPGKRTMLDSSGISIPSSSSVGNLYSFSSSTGVEQPSNNCSSTAGKGFKGGPIDDTTEQSFLYVKGAAPPFFSIILKFNYLGVNCCAGLGKGCKSREGVHGMPLWQNSLSRHFTKTILNSETHFKSYHIESKKSTTIFPCFYILQFQVTWINHCSCPLFSCLTEICKLLHSYTPLHLLIY